MRVSIDVDGVIREFQPYWAELYCNWFGGGDIEFDLLDKWDACTRHTHFATEADFFAWFDRADGWAQMPWVRGSRGGIDTLSASYPIVFATSRSTSAAVQDARRLTGLWPKAQLRTNLSNKTVVPSSIHIDDSPAVAQSFEAAGRQMILFDQPWNREVPTSDFVHRALDWNEVVFLVEEYI